MLFLNNQPPPKEINLDTLEDPIGGHNPTYDGTKQIYSGFIVPDPTTNYTVKFTKAGNFPFICLIHPGMDGTVTVLSQGLYVPTQAQIDADGKKVQANGEAAVRRMTAAAPTAATRSATALLRLDGACQPLCCRSERLRRPERLYSRPHLDRRR